MGQYTGKEKELQRLPSNLKDNILHLMCKRGTLTDTNIQFVGVTYKWNNFCYCVFAPTIIWIASFSFLQLLHNNLKVLDLSECEITDASLKLIAATCTKLRKLDINSVKESKTSVSATGRQCIEDQIY